MTTPLDVLSDPAAVPHISDLLEEVSEPRKNHVRVQVYRAVKGPAGIRHKRVIDELGDPVVAMGPALVLHDSLRVLDGKRPVYFDEAMRRLDGELVDISSNLRTTVGIDYTANSLGGTQPSVASYVAISNNTGTPAVGDTSSTVPWSSAQAVDAAGSGTTGEWTALGLSRVLATYGHSNGVASYTQTASWTASGTATATRMAGMFGGAAKTAQGAGATNILYLANTFTSTTLATNDQLSLTWTVNV